MYALEMQYFVGNLEGLGLANEGEAQLAVKTEFFGFYDMIYRKSVLW